MSLNAAALKMLADKGFTPSEMVEFAALVENPQRSKAAERQARYRIRQREKEGGDVTDDVTCDATSDVTPPPKEEYQNPPSSEANASGGTPPADPLKQMFDLGVHLLTETGCTEKQARSLLGKWRKAKSPGDVISGLVECRARAISNPVEWLEKRFQAARYVSASGYEYRGSLEQIAREAQRRSDHNTYWQVQVDLKQSAAA